MTRQSTLRRSLTSCVFITTVIGVLIFPASNTLAYTGQQFPRDDIQGTPYVLPEPPDNWQQEVTPNGYDNDDEWAQEDGPTVTQMAWNSFDWFPYKSPSPAVLCPAIHIANSTNSFDDVNYTAYHPNGTGAEIVAYSQFLNKNTWPELQPGQKYYNTGEYGKSYIEMIGSSGTYYYHMTADVIEFHYDSSSNYTTCGW